MNKILMSWSGGKDSTMALLQLQRERWDKIAGLLTTITTDYDRISIHGVRRELLHRQASALGLPLYEVAITKDATNEEYEREMKAALETRRGEGVDAIAFGDLFLEDIRLYRQRLLAGLSLQPLFPVWGWDTTEFIKNFVALGFKTIITCVDSKRLDSSFAGRIIDEKFLDELPPLVDPCGENGEFHTFVFDGPLFREAISFNVGETIKRGDNFYCDLLPF
ncbi:MAG: diphthine--ammonia ligase [Pyrinomonadaceae bacterium]|nr:diphthine--ammonia ligase [Pyrinomonadaceae bacterium]